MAVEGCCHGELDRIYEAVTEAGRAGPVVDLLLICGDFESIEQESDLQNISVPDKYKHMNTFHQYVTGEKVAPVLTVFIGGNHEASNVLQSLYYGGFVAPNIYFLGFAGVVDFGFLRLCGVSGISNDAHYRDGHYERPPYDASALRSIYHLRELEVYRLSHLRDTASFAGTRHDQAIAPPPPPPPPPPAAAAPAAVCCPRVNVMLSHDWPRHIWHYGDCGGLLRKKPGLAEDVRAASLGSAPLWELLCQLRPHFWFCAHHHVKFPALVPWEPLEAQKQAQAAAPPPPPLAQGQGPELKQGAHDTGAVVPIPLCVPVQAPVTRFLALDKVLPHRAFLQVLTIPAPAGYARDEDEHEYAPYELRHTVEWLSVLQRTHRYLQPVRRPAAPHKVPCHLQPLATPAELQELCSGLQAYYGARLAVPGVLPRPIAFSATGVTEHRGDPQTDRLLAALGLPHVWTVPYVSMPVCGGQEQANPLPPPPPPLSAVPVPVSTSAAAKATSIADGNEIDI